MRIVGIDFTSAPRPQKPIVAAWGVVAHTLGHSTLTITQLQALTSLQAFADLLKVPDVDVIGLDVPFGQPRPFIEAVVWGHTWVDVVKTIGNLPKADFLRQIKTFRDGQAVGQKHLLRPCDRRAGAISPMMVHGVPIGRMWYVAAPILLASGISIAPNHPTPHPATALEVYPALVAKAAAVGPYKSDNRRNHSHDYSHDHTPDHTPDHLHQRTALLHYLQNHAPATYGVRVALSEALTEQCLVDGKGDRIDAVCAAVQAAWAARQPAFGIPTAADPLEGWICDPHLNQ